MSERIAVGGFVVLAILLVASGFTMRTRTAVAADGDRPPVATPAYFGDTFFVSSQVGSDAQAGTRDFPFATIQTAIGRVTTNRRTILVMPGTYWGPLSVTNLDVHLIGEHGPDSTIIRGDSISTILTFSITGPDSSVVEGFTFTENHAGGIYLSGGTGFPSGFQQIRNNKFTNLRSLFNDGGAITVPWSPSGGPRVLNNIFTNCRAEGLYNVGGAIGLNRTGVTVAGNVFDSCYAGDRAGAIWVGFSAYVDGATEIVNNTFYNNSAKVAGSAIYVQVAGRLTAGEQQADFLANNIFHSNGPTAVVHFDFSSGEVLRNNLFFQNAFLNAVNGATIGTGNVYADPLLADPAMGDFHILCGSPAFDAGRLPLPFGFVTDIDGDPRNAYAIVDIGADEYIDQPVAEFAPDLTIGCEALTVRFTNLTECSTIPRQYFWDFGDNTTATSPDPIKSYAAPGLYTVTLTAFAEPFEPGGNSTIVKTDLIRVQPQPSTAFSFGPLEGCVPFDVSFQRDGIPDDDGELAWRFGDGAGQDSVEAPVHTYTTSGTYFPTVVVTNVCGTDSLVATVPVIAKAKPTLTIATSVDADSIPPSETPCFPLAVRFHPGSDQNLSAYSWDFGDNSFSTEVSPVHVYDDNVTRSYSVRLIGTGDCDTATAIHAGFVTVRPRPTVVAAVDSTEGCAPWTVTFRADTTGSEPGNNFDHFLWDFGDGDSAFGATAQHAYISTGNYTPQLRWQDYCDTGSLAVPTLSVTEPPAAAYVPGVTVTGAVPLNVGFSDQSSGNPTSWLWDFGDGTTSALQSPTHAYEDPGVYDVSLTASNLCGTTAPLLRTGLVVAAGFRFVFDSLGTNGDTSFYNADIDTVVAEYPADVFLSAALLPTPRRGTFTALIDQASGRPPYQSGVSFVRSPDLATGSYPFRVTAADPLRRADTVQVAFSHTGINVIERSTELLDFDSVVVGESITMLVWLRNIGPPGSGITLSIDSAWTDDPVFSVAGFDAPPVAPGDSLALRLAFSPTAIRTFDGVLTVATDNPAFVESGVNLTGRGIPEQVPPCLETVTPPDSSVDVLIDRSVVFTFCEPLLQPGVAWDEVVYAFDRNGVRLDPAAVLNGAVLTLTPTSNWPPDDSVRILLQADNLMDAAGNRLDGNGDGNEQGSPLDNVNYWFTTSPGVRPGDANNDRVVDERDILPVGLFWLLPGGIPRSTQPGWNLEPARPWTPRAATHADCNGDGSIDSMDVCPIAEFFDSTVSVARVVGGAVVEELAGLDQSVLHSLIRALEYCDEPTSAGHSHLRDLLGELAKSPGAVPHTYYLAQNYPNPFNAATVIEYGLPYDANISIALFNVRGERVALVAQGPREAGHHRLVINAGQVGERELSSGVYFLRLQSSDFQQTRKLMLLK